MKTEKECLIESLIIYEKTNNYIFSATKKKISEIGLTNFPLDFLEFFRDLEQENKLKFEIESKGDGILKEIESTNKKIIENDEENVEYLSKKVEFFLLIFWLSILFVFYYIFIFR